MNFLSLIKSKRAAQLGEMVAGVVSGQLPDYQLTTFLMAVFFRGLNPAETTAPLLACLGFRVLMISGRGLGITGFQTLLPARRITKIVQEVG